MGGYVDEIASSFAFQKNPDPMLVFDVGSLRILAANEAAFEKYGYSRDDFLSMSLSDIRPAEDRPWLRRFVDVDIPQGKRRTESRHRTRDGNLLDVEVGLTLVQDGERRLAMAAIHDVSTYKAEIRRLIKSGWLSPTLWLPAPVAIIRRDDMRFLYANPLAHSLLELARAELFEHSLSDLIPDRHSRQALRHRLRQDDFVTDFRAELKIGKGSFRRLTLGLKPLPFLGERALAVVLQDAAAQPAEARPS